MIAGVALVAAGEFVHVGQPARVIDASQPLPPPSVIATTAPADALSEPAAAAVPVDTSEKSPRPAVSRKGTGRTNTRASALPTQGRTATPTTTKAAPSRSSNAFAQSSRNAVETRRKDEHGKPKSKTEKSDHGLLRIRFVWDNPFR